MTATKLTATVLPEFAAVQLAVTDAPAGPLEVLRTDVNGTSPVRQLDGQETTAGTLALVDYEPAMTGPVTYQLLGARTNLIANPSAEVNASNWGSSRVTVSRVADTGGVGAWAFRGTINATAGALSQYVYPAATQPVVEGETWSAALRMRRSTAGPVRLQLSWLTAGGSTVSATVLPNVDLAANTWGTAQLSGTCPATAVQLRVFLFAADDMAIGATLDWDAVQLVEEATPGPYVEGTESALVSATVNLPLTAQPVLAVVGDPANSAPVLAVRSYDETSVSGSPVLTIYGGGRLVVTRPLELRTGSVGLHVETYAEAKSLRAILAPGVIAQLRQPEYPGMDLYLAVESVNITPAPEDTTPAQWIVRLDYTERPVPTTPLESSSVWTWDDLAELCATWDDVTATFPTWFDVAVGP